MLGIGQRQADLSRDLPSSAAPGQAYHMHFHVRRPSTGRGAFYYQVDLFLRLTIKSDTVGLERKVSRGQTKGGRKNPSATTEPHSQHRLESGAKPAYTHPPAVPMATDSPRCDLQHTVTTAREKEEFCQEQRVQHGFCCRDCNGGGQECSWTVSTSTSSAPPANCPQRIGGKEACLQAPALAPCQRGSPRVPRQSKVRKVSPARARKPRKAST
ncbi:hypothetical protein SKAU_G00055710 [Synaphobranchus kaupii]|uniref:Uncharacterized protein n=1 Tax=Synaphobranchus kaupii TaxID=118154 RepID=A0A9Q1G4R7_SYNKA|nr:hypothetical protein SKAU_G00055710 [Synaphobranchus kaupii]